MEKEQPVVRIFCRANTTVSVGVDGDGKVTLVSADANDKSQHWIQDFHNAGNLTDEEGRRAFALVNLHAGKALSYTRGNDFELVDYDYKDPKRVELSMLWSFGAKLPNGYSSIRVLTEIGQTFNVLNGPNPKIGPISEGRVVGLYHSEPRNDHAIWKIVPIDKGYPPAFSV